MRKVIPFILILFFACTVRLYRVTNPLTDSAHWRQCTSASIAWNYVHRDGNFFHPQESGWGAYPRLFLNELPLFPYLVSLLYRIFGVHEIIGRFLAIFFSLLGLYYLFLVAKKYLGPAAAYGSAILYSILPASIYYGRTFQRQSFAIAMALGGLWYLSQFLTEKRRKYLIGWIACTSIALTLNPPTIWAGAPMLYIWMRHRGRRFLKSWDIYLGGTVIGLLVSGWFAYALTHGDAWSLKPMNREGFREFGKLGYYFLWMSSSFFATVGTVLYEHVLTGFGAGLVIIGLFLRDKHLKWFTLSCIFGVFVYFCLDISPIAIGIHHYYYLNAVPAMALCGGKGLAFLWKRRPAWPWYLQTALRTMTIVGLFSIVNLAFVWGMKDQFTPIRDWVNAGKEVDVLTPPDALILVDHDSTAVSYYCHREGWRTMSYRLDVYPGDPNRQVLTDFIRMGARYFLVTDVVAFDNNKAVAEYVNSHSRLIVEAPQHYLFELQPLENELDEKNSHTQWSPFDSVAVP